MLVTIDVVKDATEPGRFSIQMSDRLENVSTVRLVSYSFAGVSNAAGVPTYSHYLLSFGVGNGNDIMTMLNGQRGNCYPILLTGAPFVAELISNREAQVVFKASRPGPMGNLDVHVRLPPASVGASPASTQPSGRTLVNPAFTAMTLVLDVVTGADRERLVGI